MRANEGRWNSTLEWLVAALPAPASDPIGDLFADDTCIAVALIVFDKTLLGLKWGSIFGFTSMVLPVFGLRPV